MVGLRWKKADLHIHTMESKCYKDKSNTAEEWIDRVKEVGLDCVAVTDHNNYKSIDQLVELGKQREIAVFPGVEVTCDTSKIHVLCIFDSDKNGDYVHDFLGQIGIYGQAIGESQGCTSTQVFEVCKTTPFQCFCGSSNYTIPRFLYGAKLHHSKIFGKSRAK